NNKIDRSIVYKENYDNTVKGFKGELDTSLAEISKTKEMRRKALQDSITEYENKIALLKKDLENLDNEFLVDENNAKAKYDQEIAKLSDNIKIANEWASKEKKNTDILEEELKVAESMKGHL